MHFSNVHIGVTLHIDGVGGLAGRFPSDINRYPLDFLEQVLWAMSEATNGILSIADYFAAGKAESSKSW